MVTFKIFFSVDRKKKKKNFFVVTNKFNEQYFDVDRIAFLNKVNSLVEN